MGDKPRPQVLGVQSRNDDSNDTAILGYVPLHLPMNQKEIQKRLREIDRKLAEIAKALKEMLEIAKK